MLKKRKKNVIRSIFAVLFAFLLVGSLVTPVFASPTKDMLVTDHASILSIDEISSIEDKLAKINEQTGIEFAVVIDESLNENDIESAANETFREMGLGDSEKDNGLLLYIAYDDHKFRMEVGYGLEGVIPDATAKKIINTMTSSFKAEKYGQGITYAVNETAKYLNESEEYTVDFDEEMSEEASKSSSDMDFVIKIIIIILINFINFFVIPVYRKFCSSGGSSSGGYYGGFSSGSTGDGGSFGGGSSGGGGASGGW